MEVCSAKGLEDAEKPVKKAHWHWQQAAFNGSEMTVPENSCTLLTLKFLLPRILNIL